jgi:hypothetical protein
VTVLLDRIVLRVLWVTLLWVTLLRLGRVAGLLRINLLRLGRVVRLGRVAGLLRINLLLRITWLLWRARLLDRRGARGGIRGWGQRRSTGRFQGGPGLRPGRRISLAGRRSCRCRV